MHDPFEELARRSPGRKISLLGRLGTAVASEPFAELGLSAAKMPFLMTLLHSDGIVQEELSKLLFVDRAATARTLASLEKDGLVRREVDPNDRRKKRVYVTDKAHLLFPRILPIMDDLNEVLFAGLSREERKQFLVMLDRLIENLQVALQR